VRGSALVAYSALISLTAAVCLQADEGCVRLHLPALRRATFSSRQSKLRFSRESFVKPAKLESLSLYGLAVVTFQPGCFRGMTALASLKLETCGLASIPAALSGLRASLTHLALPENDALQVEDDDIATVLALRKLQMLDLRKSPVGRVLTGAAETAVTTQLHYEPAPWTLRSMQYLVDLPNAFRAQHGHVLSLQLRYAEVMNSDEDEDEYNSEEDGW